MANEIYHRSNWGNAVNDIYWADVYEKYSATNKMFIRSDYYENSNETDKLMADIYPKPSILLTPTAYDNGSLHSVKPVKTFGSELVTNGDFATDSDWTKGTGWSIENGVATCDGSQTSSSSFFTNNNISIQNKLVKFSFELKNRISGTISATVQGTGGQEFSNISNNQVYTIEVTSVDSSARITFIASSDFIGSIDNVSVKEVTEADFDFTRGSSATRVNEKGLIEDVQILSGELVQNGDFEQIGSEEITNGDFSQIGSELINSNSWSNSTSGTATITNGVIDFVNGTGYLYQGIISANTFYKIVIELRSVSQGTLMITTEGGVNSETLSTNGVHEFYLKSTSAGGFFIFAQSNFTGSIDNVSVKEVGQDWTFSDGATITDNGARIVSDGAYQYIVQNNVLTVGKQYKIQYEIVENNGGGNLKLSTSFGINPIPSTVGIHTIYAEALQTFSTIERSGACDITITNISVKEVGQNWTFFGEAEFTDDGARIYSSSGSNSYIAQDVLTNTKKYRLSYEITNSTQGSLKLITVNGVSDYPIPSSVGTHKLDFTANTGILYILRNSGATDVTIDNISVIEITDDTDLPRINYTNGEGSLLLEPQSTNLITYSEDYTDVNTWIKGQVTLDSNNIISPDGTKNASKLTISGGTPYLGNTKILTANNTYTVSCFVKKGTNRWVRLTNITSGTTGAWFDLENKVVGSRSPSSLSSSIKSYGNDWYKIQNTFIAQYGSANTFLGLSDSDNQTSSTQIGNTVYVWGFQIEEQSYATSYIPTNGSTVTRLADVCNNAGSSDLINSTEGVLYFEGSDFDTSYNSGICISDLTYDNRVLFYFDSSGNVRAYVFANGLQMVYTTSGLDYTENHKYAIKWKQNDMSVFIDGVMLHSQATGNAPTGMNNLSFTSATASSDKFRGNAKCLSVFKEALDNDQLERLTGEGYETFKLLAQANNYTII